jgi:tetratricopeptide (TPR) repeat protein
MTRVSRSAVASGVTIALLLAGVVGLQAIRERKGAVSASQRPSYLYVSSPAVVSRAALSFKSLVADVYWIRTVQHFGSARLAAPGNQNYDLLFPLLDLTTSLDPRFKMAYRFGSTFLAEAPPGGPGRPDLAIRLLEKGLAAQPDRWEYAYDLGFVHYRDRDYASAADWFGKAATVPGSPTWLPPLEAVTRTRGGDRSTARLLWSELMRSAGAEDTWMRNEAARRLRQLDALDRIDDMSRVIAAYQERTGNLPTTWADLIRAGYLPGVPVDPDGLPMQLNPYWGLVTLDPRSELNPLPSNEDSTP